ncbi:MAG: CoA pyrophosphatase [Halobacteriaceae archaeon]
MELGRVAGRSPTRVTDAPEDAAVLVPVADRGEGPSLLFTERADHLGEHPGQMSFPGGSREPEDVGLVGTALREASEEVGLDPVEVEVVGPLDDIRTITGYAVSPFVGRVPDRVYDPDEREVAEVVWLALEDLTEPRNYEVELRDHPTEGEIPVHYFRVDGYTVWGATARILTQFLGLTRDWEPPQTPDPD